MKINLDTNRVTAAALVGVGAAIVLLMVYVNSSHPFDFGTFYVAGRTVWHSPHELYSLTLQRKEQLALKATYAPWAHLPVEALLFAPLALLPFRLAFTVLGFFNLCAAGVMLYLLRNYRRGFASSLALLLPAVLGTLIGQNHILTPLILVLAFINVKNGKDGIAGAFLGLAMIRPQIAVPLLMFFAVARRWKLVGTAVIVGGTLIASSFLIVGRNYVSSYRTIARFLANEYDERMLKKMIGVRGAVGALLPTSEHHMIWTLSLSAAFLAAGLWIWSREEWCPRSSRFDSLFSLALIVSVMVSYHSFIYDLTTAGVAAVLLSCRADALGSKVAAPLLAVCLIGATFGNTGWLALPVLCGIAIWLFCQMRFGKAQMSGTRQAMMIGTTAS